MTAWFDEHVNYTQMGLNPLLANANMDPIAQANNLGPIGHFTAMVYFNTTHLGCSKARDEQAVTYGVVYACNYSPPGNIVTRHRGTNRMVALPAYPVVFIQFLTVFWKSAKKSHSTLRAKWATLVV